MNVAFLNSLNLKPILQMSSKTAFCGFSGSKNNCQGSTNLTCLFFEWPKYMWLKWLKSKMTQMLSWFSKDKCKGHFTNAHKSLLKSDFSISLHYIYNNVSTTLSLCLSLLTPKYIHPVQAVASTGWREGFQFHPRQASGTTGLISVSIFTRVY